MKKSLLKFAALALFLVGVAFSCNPEPEPDPIIDPPIVNETIELELGLYTEVPPNYFCPHFRFIDNENLDFINCWGFLSIDHYKYELIKDSIRLTYRNNSSLSFTTLFHVINSTKFEILLILGNSHDPEIVTYEKDTTSNQ